MMMLRGIRWGLKKFFTPSVPDHQETKTTLIEGGFKVKKNCCFQESDVKKPPISDSNFLKTPLHSATKPISDLKTPINSAPKPMSESKFLKNPSKKPHYLMYEKWLTVSASSAAINGGGFETQEPSAIEKSVSVSNVGGYCNYTFTGYSLAELNAYIPLHPCGCGCRCKAPPPSENPTTTTPPPSKNPTTPLPENPTTTLPASENPTTPSSALENPTTTPAPEIHNSDPKIWSLWNQSLDLAAYRVHCQ
ncbi:hypothetical protein HanIR_Chr01g0014481 [Helianthus annuus]|nr:hypothetical protein HanIR_Chr01g0014481 [Helianthus annuus]